MAPRESTRREHSLLCSRVPIVCALLFVTVVDFTKQRRRFFWFHDLSLRAATNRIRTEISELRRKAGAGPKRGKGKATDDGDLVVTSSSPASSSGVVVGAEEGKKEEEEELNAFCRSTGGGWMNLRKAKGNRFLLVRFQFQHDI